MIVRFPRRLAPDLGLALALTASLALPAAAAVTFGVRTDYATGTTPKAIAAVDVNGDGRPDMVVVNQGASTVSVRLGNGTGFGARTDFATASGPSAVAIGDVNGDGHPDLVVSSSGASVISVLMGNGLGAFGARMDYPTAHAASGVAIADMNEDGRPDVVVTGDNGGPNGIVTVHLNDGHGGFATRTSLQTFYVPVALALGDVNGDGHLDVAGVVSSQSFVELLGGDGMGALTPLGNGGVVSVGSSPVSGAFTDVNGDGWADIVTANPTGNTVSVALSDQGGWYGATADFPVGTMPKSVVVGDLNGDGRPDLVVANQASNTLSVLLGDGTGGFGAKTDFTTATGPNAVALADVNGDGRLDVLVVNGSSNSVSVLLNCTGGVLLGPKTDYTAGNTPRWVTIGDLNADGRPDLVVANMGASSVTVFLGAGASSFGAGTTYTCGAGPRSVAFGDITGDGKPDLVTANADANTISVLPGNGSGGFGAKVDYPGGTAPFSIAIADVNGDAKPDVVCANLNSNTVSVFLNNGSGGLNAKVDYACGLNPGQVSLGDVNGDGKLDAVTANSGGNNISVLLGSGTGTFGAKTDFATGSAPYTVALADLNGDGKLDAATANNIGGSTSILIGSGMGSFGAATQYAAGAGPFTVAVGDVNGDGKPDVAVSTGGSTVSVLLGDGTGALAAKVDVTAGNAPYGLALGDVNGDGRLDMVTANFGSNSASVLLSPGLTRTTLAASPASQIAGWPVTLTASVTNVSSIPSAPADSVRFFDGTTLIGAAAVSGGVATLAPFMQSPGGRAITAVFKGDTQLFGSISGTMSVRVVSTPVPAITNLADVPNDQGGELRLTFSRSLFDFVGSDTPITGYQVYRRQFISFSPQARTRPTVARPGGPGAVEMAGWDYVVTVPSTMDPVYQVVVPTTADSMLGAWNQQVFLVRATTSTSGVFYDSAPDSAYSVDNLAPVPPSPFTASFASGATHLHWGANTEPDLGYYRLYRGASASFTPGPGNLVANLPDTGYVDSGPAGSYYKLSAVDVHGNESGYAALQGPADLTGVSPDGAPRFALDAVRPNPALATNLTLSFSLPSAAPARLELFDVTGRCAFAEEVGALGAGSHTVSLANDRFAPGLYLARLTQGGASRTRRVSVVQ